MDKQRFRSNMEYFYVADYDSLPVGVVSVFIPRKGLYMLKVLCRYVRQQLAWVDTVISNVLYQPPDDEKWDNILAVIDEMEGYLMSPRDRVLADITLDSPATYINIDNLNYNETGPWDLTVTLTNALEETINVYWFVNGKYTLALYHTQLLLANGTAIAAARSNNPVMVGLVLLGHATITGLIAKDPYGVVKYLSTVSRYNDAYVDAATRTIVLGTLETNVTSLRIESSVANGLGTGTRVLLLSKGA